MQLSLRKVQPCDFSITIIYIFLQPIMWCCDPDTPWFAKVTMVIHIKSPAGQSFWHPNLVIPSYLLPRPRPDQNIVDFMTQDRHDYILPGPDQNRLKHLSSTRKPKINKFQTTCTINRHVNMPWNEVITSYNVLIRNNNHFTLSVREWETVHFSLSPKS